MNLHLYEYVFDSISSEVKQIVKDHLQLSFLPRNTDRLREDLKADNLDCTQIIIAVEEKFDISIPSKEADDIVTVKDLIDLCTKYKNK